MALVSVITVNFNQPGVTLDLLKSLNQHYASFDLELILVDNGSEINHEADFKKEFPTVSFIRSETNLGFAGGNNLGLKIAKGEYILLLNNDTEVTKGCLEVMIQEFESNPDIGLLSPLLLYFDNKNIIQYAGFTPLNYLTARNNCIGQYDVNEGQFSKTSTETGFCHGAAVMCKRTDLLKAGIMDESYFLYYEELDWCEKFKKIGKKIWFTGKTHIFHKESISVGKESAIKTYFFSRNRMLFIRKNTNLLNTFIFSVYYTLVVCPKMILKYLAKGRFDLAKYVIKGLWWNFTNGKNSSNLGFKVSK